MSAIVHQTRFRQTGRAMRSQAKMNMATKPVTLSMAKWACRLSMAPGQSGNGGLSQMRLTVVQVRNS